MMHFQEYVEIKKNRSEEKLATSNKEGSVGKEILGPKLFR